MAVTFNILGHGIIYLFIVMDRPGLEHREVQSLFGARLFCLFIYDWVLHHCGKLNLYSVEW
jgi:hypothetical protein